MGLIVGRRVKYKGVVCRYVGKTSTASQEMVFECESCWCLTISRHEHIKKMHGTRDGSELRPEPEE